MFRNRLLSTYSRKELEDIFIEECKTLDSLATELFDVERELSKYKTKDQVIEGQIEQENQQEVEIKGKDIPKLNKKIKKEIRNLLFKIDELDLQLRRAEVTKNEELRELNYFRSFFVFPNKKYRLDDFEQHSPIQQKQDIIEELEELFKSSKNWDSKSQYLTGIQLMKLDLDSAISYFEKINPNDSDELVFQEKRLKDQILDKDHEILQFQEEIDKKKQAKKKIKAKVNDLEDKLNDLIEKRRDHDLEKTALENKIKKLESQLPDIEELQSQVNKLETQKLEIKSDIGAEKCRIARSLGINIINNNIETMNDDIEINEMRRINQKLKASIAESQAVVDHYKNELEKAKKSIEEARTSIQTLKSEYSALRDKYYTAYSQCPENPFENQSFMYFIYDMMQNGMTLDNVLDMIRQIEILENKVKTADAKILKMSRVRKLLNKELYEITEAQRARYNDFQDQIAIQQTDDIFLFENQTAVLFAITDTFVALHPRESVCLHVKFNNSTANTQMFHAAPSIEEMQIVFACDKQGLVFDIVSNGATISLYHQNGQLLGSTKVDLTPLVAEQDVLASVQILSSANTCLCAFHLNAKLISPLQ